MSLVRWESICAPKNEGGLGVRDPHIVNLSLVAKLNWRFLTSGDSVWVELLRAKYLRNRSFWDSNFTYNSSQLWKGMIQVKDLIKSSCCWRVVNGNNINIWKDPWVDAIPGFRVTDSSNSHSELELVKDLMIPNTTRWNESLIQFIFDPHIASAIINTPIDTNGECDQLIWRSAPNGVFTAKSMYKLLCNLQPTSSSSNGLLGFEWGKFWQIRGIAPRVQIFFWKAAHKGIAVGNVLRRISNSNGWCNRCNGIIESVDHTLLHCPSAVDVWKLSGIPLSRNHRSLNLTQFFKNLINLDVDYIRKGCAIIWEIWKARNSVIFSGKVMDAQTVYNKALAIYEEYKNPLCRDHVGLGESVSLMTLPNSDFWIPPPTGFVKFNVDGACKGGLMAAAVVLRGSNGEFLRAESLASMFGNPVEAEARAFKLAVDLVEMSNVSSAIIEGDASNIVHWINSESCLVDWRVRTLIESCRDARRRNPNLIFSYVPRSCNKVAHALGSFAITHEVTSVWLGGLPPPFILDHMFADLANLVMPNH